jgi:hypothetical protein
MSTGLTFADILGLGAIVACAWVLACAPGVVRYLVARRGRGGR